MGITIITINEKSGSFGVREINKNVAIQCDEDQFVLEGIARPDDEIINHANEFVTAPYDGQGDYNGWRVERDSSCVDFKIVLSDGNTVIDIISDTANFSLISEEEANARYQSGHWPLNAWCVPTEIAQKVEVDPENEENFKILDKNAIWTAYYESI